MKSHEIKQILKEFLVNERDYHLKSKNILKRDDTRNII
jgi:hypothetical protein